MPWINTTPQMFGASKYLVVIVHGWMVSKNATADMVAAIRSNADLADADILLPEYNSDLWSTEDAFRLAAQLDQLIERTCSARQQQPDKTAYEKIFLVAHSAGSLLVRKAFLYGQGITDDHPNRIGRRTAAKDWVSKVDRIVLLGGLNRGWSLEKRPQKMGYGKYSVLRFLSAVSLIFGRNCFITYLRQGEPFVANLRVQWIKMVSDPSIKEPTVIQMLGDSDDIVDEEDSKDVIASVHFIWLPVSEADHGNIIRFPDNNAGLGRKEKFLEAMAGAADLVRNKYIDKTPKADIPSFFTANSTTPEHIVFVMHGIRDDGDWTSSVAAELCDKKWDKSVLVSNESYGYFPMLRFLLSVDRQKNVRWFMDRYTEAIALYPKAKVSYVAHSNGTYILANALRRYTSVEIERVMFAGSVVPRNFPWSAFIKNGRVKAIRNDIASADWVVAWLPAVFERLHNFTGLTFLSIGDIGEGGYRGFLNAEAKKNEVRYVIGDHGAAIQKANHTSIAEFIHTGNVVKNEAILRESRQGTENIIFFLGKTCWIIWIVLLAVVISIGYFVAHTGLFGLPPVWLGSLYALLIIVLMLSI